MAAVETKTMSLMELPTDALGLICDHLVATYVQAMRIHARVYNTIYAKHIGDYYQMTDGRMLVDVAFDGEREEGHGSMLYPVRRFALKSEWRTIFGDRRSEQKRVDPRLNLRSFEDWKKYYRVQQYMKELIADFHALDLTCRHMHSRVVPWARLYAAVRAHMDQTPVSPSLAMQRKLLPCPSGCRVDGRGRRTTIMRTGDWFAQQAGSFAGGSKKEEEENRTWWQRQWQKHARLSLLLMTRPWDQDPNEVLVFYPPPPCIRATSYDVRKLKCERMMYNQEYRNSVLIRWTNPQKAFGLYFYDRRLLPMLGTAGTKKRVQGYIAQKRFHGMQADTDDVPMRGRYFTWHLLKPKSELFSKAYTLGDPTLLRVVEMDQGNCPPEEFGCTIDQAYFVRSSRIPSGSLPSPKELRRMLHMRLLQEANATSNDLNHRYSRLVKRINKKLTLARQEKKEKEEEEKKDRKTEKEEKKSKKIPKRKHTCIEIQQYHHQDTSHNVISGRSSMSDILQDEEPHGIIQPARKRPKASLL